MTDPLGDLCHLGDGKVEVLEIRSNHRVSSHVAKVQAAGSEQCKLCSGEMLYDSCSQVCGREQCRLTLVFLGLQKDSFRAEFWKRFDALPREATRGGIGLWNLEQMMADAEGEVAA
jgi:hypothetical protein